MALSDSVYWAENWLADLQQWLVTAMDGMSADHFEWAMSIMVAHEPKLAEQLGDQEISPDLDTFNALTLRQLQWLAKSHPPSGDGISAASGFGLRNGLGQMNLPCTFLSMRILGVTCGLPVAAPLQEQRTLQDCMCYS